MPATSALSTAGAYALHPEEVTPDYADLLAFHGIEPDRLVLLHPGSRTGRPAWPVEHYAQVADRLAEHGWQIAIVGHAREPERNGAVLGAMQAAALFLAGMIVPEMLMRLIRDARFLLADDAAPASPAALARALGIDTPQIALAERQQRLQPETVAADVRAALECQSAAHPGKPFTLHMPMLRNAA